MADTNPTGRMSGLYGTFTINDTSSHTKDFDTIQVTSATVFSSLTIDGSDNKVSYISTPASAVSAGTVITAPTGKSFTEVQLTSGEITVGISR